MSRLGITPLLISGLLCAAGQPGGRVSVVVVAEPGVDAYDEALDGVTAVLPPSSFRVLDGAGKGFEQELAAALGGSGPHAVIAVGSRALFELRARHVSAPLVAAMVLRRSESDSGIRRVDLEIPLAAQLAAMRVLWPGRTRAGIIRNSSRNSSQACTAADALVAAARKEGFSALVVDCDGPGQLLKAMATFKGRVDFVLCFPDPDLYNPVTVKPLVLASLEDRLPLVGFSPSFVRAGAAAGIFADYREIGRRAAEIAQRLLRGEERSAEESPRKTRVAINQRVTRLLGVTFHGEALGAEVFR